MKVNELKVGDRVKFVHGNGVIRAGYIDQVVSTNLFYIKTGIAVENNFWVAIEGKDILAKLEEKEIPIDRPIKYEFVLNATCCGHEMLSPCIGREDSMFLTGYCERFNSDIKIPFKGNNINQPGKKFKVTVEEIE